VGRLSGITCSKPWRRAGGVRSSISQVTEQNGSNKC
jgi:hypothetical protein